VSSIADAVRARELEARVTALEEKMAELLHGDSANFAWRLSLIQGQINKLRARDGDPVKADDAA
jgi:hypothetical protein